MGNEETKPVAFTTQKQLRKIEKENNIQFIDQQQGIFQKISKEKKTIDQSIYSTEKIFQILYYDNGCVYQGSLNSQQQREGFGKYQWKEGNKYEGFWKNDVPQGYGKLIYSDGDFYQGNWENGKANGYGEYLSSKGIHYQGQWQNDVQHGEGIEINLIENSKFVGNFKNGKKEGYGEIFTKEGGHFKGQFKNNFMNGQGTYRWHNGKVYQGQWVNNQMSGIGIMIWPNG